MATKQITVERFSVVSALQKWCERLRQKLVILTSNSFMKHSRSRRRSGVATSGQ